MKILDELKSRIIIYKENGMNFYFTPKTFLKFILLIIAFLFFTNLAGLISKFVFGHGNLHGVVRLFNFNSENNIPTFYSSLALLFSSVLLGIIACQHKKAQSQYLSWAFLAVIFLFLSIDETSSIHEKLALPKSIVEGTGLLYYSWIIPYGICVLVFAAAYLKFLMRLSKEIRVLFILAGSLFVIGAIGFEALGGQRAEIVGTNDLLYAVYFTSEELLEMLGIATFNYALLTYITENFHSLTLSFTNNK